MDINKKSRLEYLFEVFKHDYEKAIEKRLYHSNKPIDVINSDISNYYDNLFYDFYDNFYLKNNRKLNGETQMEILFNFFIDCDPSDNKEYVGWFINLYRTTVKERISIKNGYNDGTLTTEEINNFFEDAISKTKSALETFSFLKKTNVLNIENRDINRYRKINEFIRFVIPYMSSDDGDDSVHTLDHNELKCVQNYVNGGDKAIGSAELVFENSEWVIVITHDKTANSIFGKYTTWCTAGTRYGNMFDGYHSRGYLFVLIRKGYGSKKSIKSHPEYRLQFHFEDDQFMDANDSRIDINTFLFNNPEIKRHFRSYIIKTVLPKRQAKKNKQTDDIKYLLNLGFGDEIIKILKESKPEIVDFSGHKIETKYLESIGDIGTIKKLDLSDCGINKLPESIKNLKNLEILIIRNNKEITEIPDWISNNTNLNVLDCAGCDIKYISDLSNNVNITQLVLDFNINLKELPKNIGKLTKLNRLTAANCDIRFIDDDMSGCNELCLLALHANKNLERIPIGISKLPKIMAICIDDTKISEQTRILMQENGNGYVCVLKFGQ